MRSVITILPRHLGIRSAFFLQGLAGLLLAAAVSAGERFNAAKLAEMDVEMVQAITEHRLPGGVLWIESRGSNYHKAFGCRALVPKKETMTEDTIFDVASLTKVLATTPGLMVLVEQGKVKLDEPVASYWPEFGASGKERITVRHLLTHTSGLGRTLNRSPDWSEHATAFTALCAVETPNPPGTVCLYSDLNFILLGELIQRVSGSKLNEFVAKYVFQPLRMTDTGFVPPPALMPRIAPTEKIGREVLRGTVHDPKAQSLGGVAGHAGVFSTARDVARFARMMLNEGELEGVRILSPESVRLMTSVQTSPAVEARRGLGWDIDSDFSRPRGNLFPIGSYGMTGFTGVCLWIDPFSKSFWMLLSNRVHPNQSGNIYALQRKLGTLAAEAIQDFDFQLVPGALPARASSRN